MRLFRNTFAVAVGRNLNALGRLVIASLVVRNAGTEVFGLYSVIVAVLTIADWILDFGTTDVFVREIVKNPKRYDDIRRVLVAFKLIQTPVAMSLMLILLLSMQYPESVIHAGFIAAGSLGFFWGIAVYRSIFKATLTMEREMLAEFSSVLVMIPLVIASLYFDLGIVGLMWSLFLSRAVFLAGCMVLSRGERSLSFSGVRREDVAWLGRASFIIGIIGLLIVINNSIEIVLLSRLSQMSDVAYFSGAQKLVWPVFMVFGAVGTSFYPVLAAQYQRKDGSFNKSCQQALDATLIFGGLAVSVIYSGAEFFLSLIGPDLVPAAPALRVLIVACVIKGVAAVVGPVLFIVSAQAYAFRYFSISLLSKVMLIYWLAPVYGFLGVAWITLAVEAVMITPLTLYCVRKFTGYQVNLSVPVRVMIISVLTIVMVNVIFTLGNLLNMILAGVIYCMFIVLFRVADIGSLKKLIAQKDRHTVD